MLVSVYIVDSSRGDLMRADAARDPPGDVEPLPKYLPWERILCDRARARVSLREFSPIALSLEGAEKQDGRKVQVSILPPLVGPCIV